MSVTPGPLRDGAAGPLIHANPSRGCCGTREPAMLAVVVGVERAVRVLPGTSGGRPPPTCEPGSNRTSSPGGRTSDASSTTRSTRVCGCRCGCAARSSASSLPPCSTPPPATGERVAGVVVPPGRAGQLWLRRRLQTPARGVDLLEREQPRYADSTTTPRRRWRGPVRSGAVSRPRRGTRRCARSSRSACAASGSACPTHSPWSRPAGPRRWACATPPTHAARHRCWCQKVGVWCAVRSVMGPPGTSGSC